ncbi:MATE family efflux transporter [Brevibacillus sp. SYP-B805]|uniref:MATE family efflux transporter n=1 Tax=Brevibacillus sp. SYP-B805 TaxID=1578199 RepID=UPI0013EA6276|nr:MATE family efflux transporter [Brevibacillus sp. SYP-B805]NGQ96713.1 MATE family efflux transporter [Brevibacillus sp. SYP-B805]
MAQTNDRGTVLLTEGPIGKTLFFFALPVLLGNVLQSLNGSINSIWVGRFLGEQALAATSNANIIMFFLLSWIFGVGMAATILIGQSIGADNLQQAKRVVGTSAVFFAVLSIAIAAAGYLLTPHILRWLNTPPNVIPLALSYTQIIFVAIPFLFGYNFIMMILRGSGDSKTPFYFLLLSVALDIALNPLLIFGIGPLPELGITGSALATFFAQSISLLALFFYLYRKKYLLRITWQERHLLRFDRQIIGALIKKGIPMGLHMIVVTSSAIALVHLVNRFGADATAAFGAATQLSNYVQMPAMAIGAAVSSMTAQNVGAGKWDRVHRTTIAGIVINFIMSGTLATLMYLFDRQALGLFLPDEGTAISIGLHINAVTLWSFVLFGINFVVAGVIRSTGAVMIPLLVTFIALWGVRIPLAYWLADAYSFNAIWWSFPISFSIAVVLSVVYYLFGSWKKAKMLASQ